MAECWQQTFDYHLGRHTLSPCWWRPSAASSNISDVNDNTASRMDEFYSLIDRGGLWKNSFGSELYISRCVRCCWLMLDTHGTHVQVSHYFIYMGNMASFLFFLRAPKTKRGKRSWQHPDQRWSSTPLTTSIISQRPCMLSYFKYKYSEI